LHGWVSGYFPVNFRLFDGSVVFRTGEGTKLNSAIWNAGIAFEADAVNSVFEGMERHDRRESRGGRGPHRDRRDGADGTSSVDSRFSVTRHQHQGDSISGRRIVGNSDPPRPDSI